MTLMLLLALPMMVLMSSMVKPSSSTSSSEDMDLLFTFQHVQVISFQQFEDLNKNSAFHLVYYFVKDSEIVRQFLQKYEMSAQVLKLYNMNLSVYNCNTDKSQNRKCEKKNVHESVYIYSDGEIYFKFNLDMLIDADTMIVYSLRLLLLEQVPQVSSRNSLHRLEMKAIGKQDIIIGCFNNLGIKKLRIFLEVAYAFQDKFLFVITKHCDRVINLRDSEHMNQKKFIMFVSFCAESNTDPGLYVDTFCHTALWEGEVSFAAVARFVKGLSEPALYNLPADGLNKVMGLSNEQPIIFVYYDNQAHDHLNPVEEITSLELRGLAKVVLVNMDSEDGQILAKQQGVSGKPPVFVVKKNDVITLVDQNKDWSRENIQSLLKSVVFSISEEQYGHPDQKMCIKQKTGRNNKDDYNEVLAVEIQDDLVAAAVSKLSNEEMMLDYVPALLKSNFYQTINSADMILVLFYHPFDHISMAFLRVYGEAAQTLAMNLTEPNILARVNCFDGTDLCTAENITTYPIVRIYQKGQESREYARSLDLKSVVKAVKLIKINSPIQLKTKDEIQGFIAGDFPQSFRDFTPSSVLLLSQTNTDYEDIFNKVAKEMSTITTFGVVQGELSTTIAGIYNLPVPSVLAVHRSDSDKPIRSLNVPLTKSSLSEFVEMSIIASVPKLTTMNLPILFAKKQPFAILFINTSDPTSSAAKEVFTQVAMSGLINEITFCWMKGEEKTLGRSILFKYAWRPTLPMITVVSHEQGALFNYQPADFNVQDTSNWLAKVVAKKVQPSRLLHDTKWLPPGPHYDFLAAIDEMKKSPEQSENVPAQEVCEKPVFLYGNPEFGPTEKEQMKDNELRKELLELKRIFRKSKEKEDGMIDDHLKMSVLSYEHLHQEL